MAKKQGTKKHIVRELGEILMAFAVAWLAYQGLAQLTGTPLPIVAVVSDSMYHTAPFDAWWQERSGYYEKLGTDNDTFVKYPFRNGLARGDLLVVINDASREGDVVIYEKPEQGISIVHRIIDVQPDNYIIKGDNNFAADTPVPKERVVGKVVLAVPLLGYPRFLLFAFGI